MLFVAYPLLHGGFFPTMDDVQVVRIDEMTRELLSGQFPVRIMDRLGNGAGYLLFNFYGTLSYYIGAFYHLLGIPLVKATKFTFLTGYIIGGIGMYFLTRKFSDKITASICTILFLTATYVNYDVYTRGSMGEFFGFVMLPLLFWSFARVKSYKKLSEVLLAGLIYAFAIIAHPLTAVMGSFFLVVLVISLSWKKERIIGCLAGIILGLLLAAFSWMPVAFEQQYLSLTTNTFETQQYSTNFFTPLQLGGLQKIAWGIKPPLLGVGLFIGALLGVCISFKKSIKGRRIGIFAALSLFLSFFMISSWSKFLWDLNPYVRLVQFPWRYLVITTIASVMLIGVFLSNFKNTWIKILIGLLFIVPAITLQYSYLRPSSYNYIAVYTADDACNTSTWAQEYLPKWVKTCLPKNNKIPLIQTSQRRVVTNIKEYAFGRKITFNISGDESVVTIKKYYFPGWEVNIDGKNVTTYPSTKYGLLTAFVPSGQHEVTIVFTNTWDRIIGNVLSLVSFVTVFVVGVYIFYKTKR